MSDETEAPPIKPRKRHRRRRRFGLWMLLSIAFLMGMLGLAGMSVTGRSLIAPVWLTEQVAARVNSSLPNGKISLGRLALEVNERGVPRILLRDVGIYDARGAEIARLNDIGARFSVASLLRGEFQPEALRLNGAQVSMFRRTDGKFDVSFGAGNRTTGTMADLLDAIDRLFQSTPLAGTHLVDAWDLTITVEDARSGRFWQVTGGRLQIQQETDTLDFSIAFEVFNGTEDLAEVVVGGHSDKRDSSASVGATFKNAAASDIALQTPALTFLGILDAPISGAVRADFGGTGSLTALAGSLEVAAGALRPTEDIKPVGFESGKAYFRYDPALERIRFSDVSVVSDAGSASVSGQAYLRDFVDTWPSTMLGQFNLNMLELKPEGLFAEAVGFSEGAVDFRMKLSPFQVEIGQLVLGNGDEKIQAKGSVAAAKQGWIASIDANLERMTQESLLALWPMQIASKSRKWVSENVRYGQIRNAAAAVRIKPDSPPLIGMTFEFSDATVRYIKTMPVLTGASGYGSFNDFSFTVALEKGAVAGHLGGSIDLAGTSYHVANTRQKPPNAVVDLKGASSITAALSLLNEPPFSALRNSSQPVDFADGDVEFRGSFGFQARPGLKPQDVDYEVSADLKNFASDRLIRNRVLSSRTLELKATPEKVEVGGPMQIGAASMNLTWHHSNDPLQAGKSKVTGDVELSQVLLDEFQVGLPAGSVSGKGIGTLEIDFETGKPPLVSLVSDLKGLGLTIAALGWSKAADVAGNFSIAGTFGTGPTVKRLELSAPDLNAAGGKVTFTENGLMKEISFEKVTAGNWFDAPLTLTGRGPGQVPALTVASGMIDIRNASFGSSGEQSGGGPVQLALDELIISEGIKLTQMTASLDGSLGYGGEFSGKVNGGAAIAGQLVPVNNGLAIRIKSQDAGNVLRDAGVFKNGVGGGMNLTLRPRPERGVYAGNLNVTNIRVANAPALTELLSAISIVGLLDQMNGPGIAFSNVDADFRLSPTSVILNRSSATGPSLGVSLEGTYDLGTRRMDMQGVLSPVYFLNGIGQVFSRRGEGVFGFVFRLKGLAEEPQVSVNPLSILTPGMFREIFRQQPPTEK